MKDQLLVLNDFKKEYALELLNSAPEIQELIRLGMTEDELRAEIILRGKYGDKIYFPAEGESASGDKKSVEKITSRDLAGNKRLLMELEAIENDTFNDSVETILKKAKK